MMAEMTNLCLLLVIKETNHRKHKIEERLGACFDVAIVTLETEIATMILSTVCCALE